MEVKISKVAKIVESKEKITLSTTIEQSVTNSFQVKINLIFKFILYIHLAKFWCRKIASPYVRCET